MTTQVKNLFFPVPKHKANTLSSLGVSQSYEAGTLNFVPTMAPISPRKSGRKTVQEEQAEETLEQLDESLEYLQCVGKCRRRPGVLTHAQRLFLNSQSHGAHGDALYGRTPRGGGSLHDALLTERLRRGRKRREDALRREGFNLALSEQKAKNLERGQRAAETRSMKNALKNAGIDVEGMSSQAARQRYAQLLREQNIEEREHMSLSTDPNAAKPRQHFAHRDSGGTYHPPMDPTTGEEAVDDIDSLITSMDNLGVTPGNEGSGRAPTQQTDFGGLNQPDGAGLFP